METRVRWMNILKGKYGPKSRITGLPMDNSHPNTSNLTTWTRFRVRSKQWAAMNLYDIDRAKGLLGHLPSAFGTGS